MIKWILRILHGIIGIFKKLFHHQTSTNMGTLSVNKVGFGVTLGPASILDNWVNQGGLPSIFSENINAALLGTGQWAGKAYFFTGDQYARFDFPLMHVDPGYPKPIAGNWTGFPDSFTSDLDAAVLGAGQVEGKAFFFKGSEYLQFDFAEMKVDEGYPKPIAGNWPGWPENFTYDLDSAFLAASQNDHEAYFFKGEEYIKFNFDTMQLQFPDAKPVSIWMQDDGWPPSFDGNFDAGLKGAGEQTGQCYFFKGKEYIRFNFQFDF